MIDSHCHLNFEVLRNNFPDIIDRAIKNHVTSILTINTKIEDFHSHH